MKNESWALLEGSFTSWLSSFGVILLQVSGVCVCVCVCVYVCVCVWKLYEGY